MIPRESASLYVSDELLDQAGQLNISVPFAVVDRALVMGWLSSHGTGIDEVLSRTSKPLPSGEQNK